MFFVVTTWRTSPSLLSILFRFHRAKFKILPFNYDLSEDLLLSEVVLLIADHVHELNLHVGNSPSWPHFVHCRHGVTSKRNTVSQLIEYLHIAYPTSDQHLHYPAICSDIQKASDTVLYHVLPSKLANVEL